MPTTLEEPGSWSILFGEGSTYGELNRAAAVVVGGIALQEAIRRGPQAVLNTFLFAPLAGLSAAYATVFVTEKVTSKKQAQELADWYSNWIFDPGEAVDEFGEKLLGASHTLIDQVEDAAASNLEFAKNMISKPNQTTTIWLSEFANTYL